jgi:prephenate dehydrogenase
MKPFSVGVLGLGLIGGSILKRLTAQGVQVAGWDPDAKARLLAKQAGCSVSKNVQDLIQGRSLIVLSCPPEYVVSRAC